ncbi:MAG: CPBP family intramembrane metalloprotease [Acidobacteriia bacterium]|nr:CPBP family intramembrane metalloprotease [Terriglobia bacterium]
MPSLGQKMTAVLVSTVLAFLILMAGQIPWSVLLALNFRDRTSAVPWSVAAMAVVLWLMWRYLGGKGWPRSTSEKRRRLLRANPVAPKTFALAFLCGGLAIIALAGYWIVFFQLVKTPANVLAEASKYPLLTVILVTAISSLVSPISEEIAFRGYCQQILESRFSAGAAVTLSSLLFMLAHANHGLYWPKLTVYFLAGVVFGTIALLTNSILTTLPVHIVADVTFFVLIWPRDAARVLVTQGGADKWFWVHVLQAIVFTVLVLLGFWRLKKLEARILVRA